VERTRFQGRTALVTGAGTGIGRAAALRLASEGASVALCGRRAAALEETARLLAAASGRAVVIPVDVRIEDEVARAFDAAERALGPVDAAVACHGVNTLARVEESTLAAWNDIVATNLTGVFLVAREAARRMRPRSSGRIVIVSSVSGRPGYRKFPGFGAYAASKYALTGLVEVLAAELEGSSVGIAMICPVGVDTEMFRRTFPGLAAELTPERTAGAIADLADPAAPAPAGEIFDLTR
jgi:NAD(P)-dependent dehydrogenase (short-subunit alcohol dehydrogenase family)